MRVLTFIIASAQNDLEFMHYLRQNNDLISYGWCCLIWIEIQKRLISLHTECLALADAWTVNQPFESYEIHVKSLDLASYKSILHVILHGFQLLVYKIIYFFSPRRLFADSFSNHRLSELKPHRLNQMDDLL